MASVVALLAAVLPAAALPLPTGQRVGDSEDPTAASIDLAQAAYPERSDQVVLGRRDLFPDNLAGSAAAGLDGPLLLVEQAPAGLATDVETEIGRLLGDPPSDCDENAAQVVLLGGELALSVELSDDVEALGYCVTRQAGLSRVETSVAVADAVIGDGPRGTLLIARDDNPADSASAGAYAAATATPIVVTQSAALHPTVRELLDPTDEAWDEVILLGGTVALSAEVEQQVRDAAGSGTSVRRIAGITRDDTAAVVARDLWGDMAGETASIVNGFTETFWTYALPGGVASAPDNAPLLYVTDARVPDPTAGYLGGIGGVTTIGPASVIPDTVKAEAEALAGGGGLGADLRVEDFPTPAGAQGTATFTIAEGDISVLFTIAGGQAGAEVTIDGITGPDGFDLGADDIPEASATPDVAILLPQFPAQPFVPGEYTVSFSSTDGYGRIAAIIKSGSATARQVIDIDYIDVSSSDDLDTPAEQQGILDLLVQEGNSILSSFNLFPGAANYTDRRDLNGDFGTVDSENGEITQLCAAVTANAGDRRALNFVFVDQVVEDGVSTGTDGLSSGLPGSVVLSGYSANCVILSTDVPDGIEAAGPVAWHEAGHLMGLQHTTEADGLSFDLLGDTPECPATNDTDDNGEVDDVECGDLADNFMFWTGIFRTMTADQAFMLARNPLFQPRTMP